MLRIALVGGSGGIGAAMLAQLLERSDVDSIHATYLNGSPLAHEPIEGRVKVVWSKVDLTDDASVKAWFDTLGPIDWLINSAGYLHDETYQPEKAINQFNAEHFARCMQINCLSSLLLSKYAASHLKSSEKAVFAALTAKVGSISDNRLGGWYSYRASKAAANMVLKSLSIEWQRSAPKIRVIALHPGTTNTALSKPFQSRVPEGKLFSAEKVAAMLITQIEQAHLHDSGRFIAYDGEELPW